MCSIIDARKADNSRSCKEHKAVHMFENLWDNLITVGKKYLYLSWRKKTYMKSAVWEGIYCSYWNCRKEVSFEFKNQTVTQNKGISHMKGKRLYIYHFY